WKRQFIDFGLAEFVFKALCQVELARYDGAFEVEPRRGGLEAAQVPTADAKLGERVVQFPLPFVAAALGLHRNEPGGKAPILGLEGCLVDVDRLHAVHGDSEAELPGAGVGDVGRVHDEGAAILGAIGDAQPAAGFAHHSGDERQRIGHGSRAIRHLLGKLARYGGGGEAPCSTALPSPLTSTWVRAAAGTSVNSSASETPVVRSRSRPIGSKPWGASERWYLAGRKSRNTARP